MRIDANISLFKEHFLLYLKYRVVERECREERESEKRERDEERAVNWPG